MLIPDVSCFKLVLIVYQSFEAMVNEIRMNARRDVVFSPPKPKAHQQKQGFGRQGATEGSGMAARFLLSPPPLIGSGPTGDPQPISGSGESRNQTQAGFNLHKNLGCRNLDGMTTQETEIQDNPTAESLTCGGCGNDGPETLMRF
ncbi:MAG: hypothetical protein KDB01_24695 [Planctomycetaceae bacterium]|nr:hypothetical protein [Planctomycetaceae bacterium]